MKSVRPIMLFAAVTVAEVYQGHTLWPHALINAFSATILFVVIDFAMDNIGKRN
jgi:hypothetical protein